MAWRKAPFPNTTTNQVKGDRIGVDQTFTLYPNCLANFSQSFCQQQQIPHTVITRGHITA